MNRAHARLNNFHNTKRQLVGHQVQPAWKPNAAAGPANKLAQQAEASGSKILLSRLPMDVSEKEVEELFRKTVGPVKECFLVYNNQGKSKGMAVVWFTKATDAATAKAKYDGKFIDGRKPLKIEMVVDEVPPATTTFSAPLTLLQRLGGPTPGKAPQPTPPQRAAVPRAPASKKHPSQPRAPVAPRPIAVAPPAPVRPGSRQRVKKGPKRLQKKPLTAAELDQEMEDYQKQALQEIEMEA